VAGFPLQCPRPGIFVKKLTIPEAPGDTCAEPAEDMDYPFIPKYSVLMNNKGIEITRNIFCQDRPFPAGRESMY
jgi:hypothetical protein